MLTLPILASVTVKSLKFTVFHWLVSQYGDMTRDTTALLKALCQRVYSSGSAASEARIMSFMSYSALLTLSVCPPGE